MRHIQNSPLFLILCGVAAVSMYVPAAYALRLELFHEARSFFYAGTLGMFMVWLVAVAISDRRYEARLYDHLLALVGVFTVLPVFLAVPFHDALRTTSFLNAYFEMVSAITTTGATLYEDPDRLVMPLHLWRGLVAWMGGFLIWVAAVAVFSPLNLGGFEVTARGTPGHSELAATRRAAVDPTRRFRRTVVRFLPIYGALTFALWIMLMIGGERAITALIHAMSVLSTSGISPIGGMQNANAGIGGEFVVFLFLLFALSRLSFSADTGAVRRDRLRDDPEFRLGIMLVFLVPILLFLRHWVGALDVNEEENFLAAIHAFWGATFTVLSFLTTTGFTSSQWAAAQDWSGLGTPGVILMGLAILGGGVATTAGGVKLLRVYALYLQGRREMEKLVHPSSVRGDGHRAKAIQRDGAYIAWIFFMLFALSFTGTTIALAAFGVEFEQAVTLSVAALTTTGPVITIAAETPIDLANFGPGVKLILCWAMVLGRLEALAIMALVSIEMWRK